jgi:hypothetical protein
MKEQPKLVLNKRTVAHLNNLEMRQVRGGDGEGDQSAKACIETDKTGKSTEVSPDGTPTIVKTLTTLILTRILC